MTTSFPTGLDTFTVPSGTSTLGGSTPNHTTLHTNTTDAVTALETKVGIDGSAVTTSLDYKVTTLQNLSDQGAADQGLKAWTTSSHYASGANIPGTAGVLTLARFIVRNSFTASNIIYDVGTAGATLTAGQNFVGIYNSSGTRVAVSADQSTNFATANTLITAAMTSPPVLAAGSYWVAILWNGTTGPTIFRANNTSSRALNAGTTAATSVSGTILTGQTSLPASFTPASITPQIPYFWFAIS